MVPPSAGVDTGGAKASGRPTVDRPAVVQEASAGACKSLDAGMAAQMEEAWMQGLAAMQKASAEHEDQVSMLQAQIKARMDAYWRLHEENQKLCYRMQAVHYHLSQLHSLSPELIPPQALAAARAMQQCAAAAGAPDPRMLWPGHMNWPGMTPDALHQHIDRGAAVSSSLDPRAKALPTRDSLRSGDALPARRYPRPSSRAGPGKQVSDHSPTRLHPVLETDASDDGDSTPGSPAKEDSKVETPEVNRCAKEDVQSQAVVDESTDGDGADESEDAEAELHAPVGRVLQFGASPPHDAFSFVSPEKISTRERLQMPYSPPFYPPGLSLPETLGARKGDTGSPDFSDFACHIPRGGSPPSAPDSPDSTLSTASGSTFEFTLRRINDEPLGLEVQPHPLAQCLVVEGVKAGTVAEAWNRQNQGELRELRPGDQIVAINGMTEVAAMWTECRSRRLVKLVVERPRTSHRSSQGSTPSTGRSSPEFIKTPGARAIPEV